MKVTIQSRMSSPSVDSVDLVTNGEATVDSLIGGFCALKSMAHESTHGLYGRSGKLLPKKNSLKEAGVKDGDVLQLGYAKEYVDTSKVARLCAIGAIGVLIGVAGLVTVILLFATTGREMPFEFGVVLDAGSSHTEIAVYNWEGDKYKGTGIVHQINSCDVDGGISSHYPDFENAGVNLIPCIEETIKAIPHEKLSTSPVFLGATAGMRLLNITDPLVSKALLFSVRCTLTSYGLDVQKVEIISGKDEGLHAWITANFLLRTLQKPSTSNNSTVGAMDLGGASTQIAYAISGNSTPDVTSLKLYGHKHKVFSKTYLCFGINEAWRRHLALLAINAPDWKNIPSPCSPNGFVFNKTRDYLFNATCTRNSAGANQPEGDRITEDVIFFTGTGETSTCSKIVNEQFDSDECKNKFGYCFKRPDSVPISDQKFLAMSTFQFMAKFMNVSINKSMDDFKQATKDLCALSEEEILSIPKTELKYVEIYCYEALYVYHFLTSGYGFDNSTWNNIDFRKKVDGTDLGWALGYMINATSAIPEETETPPVISLTTFVLLVILFSFILILSVGIVVFYFHKKKKMAEYEEMSRNVQM